MPAATAFDRLANQLARAVDARWFQSSTS